MPVADKHTERMIQYEGTTQNQRFNPSLDPSSFQLIDYNVDDWMRFAYKFAKHINFFGTDNTVVNDWQAFFIEKKSDIEALLNEENQDGTVEPHLALFICFLKLLEISRSRFNELTKRHLDFYYNEVLLLKKKTTKADKVHLLFELAKKASRVKIPKGTILNGGKDAFGKPIIFETTEELVSNQIKIGALKNVYRNSDHTLFHAQVANTLDGVKVELESPEDGWSAFGHDKEWANENYLPSPQIGFYISSPILKLSEGTRTIIIDFGRNLHHKNLFTTEITGEKGWMPLIDTSDSIFKPVSTTAQQLAFQLPAYQKATSNYDPAIHGENYDVSLPTIRVLFKHNINYKQAANFKIESLQLKVDVKEITSLKGENEVGLLSVNKSFMPFGAIPKKGAKCYITHPEIQDRFIESGTLKVKGTAKFYLKPNVELERLQIYNRILEHYPAKINILPHIQFNIYNVLKPIDNDHKLEFDPDKESPISFENNYVSTKGLTLKFSGNYNAIAKVSVTTSTIDDKVTSYIINQDEVITKPPTIEAISLDYIANSSDITFGYIHPFGSERKDKMSGNNWLPTEYIKNSYFYIGFENAIAEDIVSILIQAKEGSENPATTNPELTWEILTDKGWVDHKTEAFILEESTSDFIQTGLIKLKISKSAVNNSRLMPKGMHWLRASTVAPFDYFCKLIAVKAQAVVGIRKIEPSTEQFEQLAAGTITKMVQRISQVKKLNQPFASFGGNNQETDTAFYRRVSERLRHKNRAVSSWDYERLLLENFSDIYKAKCLNHSLYKEDKLYTKAPGHVTIIVIPDLTKRSVFDIYEPRFPKSELLEMTAFLNELSGMNIKVKVVNPAFRKVKVSADIKFYDHLDANFYQEQTKDDITQFISPWAFDINQQITFNTAVHISSMIYYLENLSYVDYVLRLQIAQEKVGEIDVFESVEQEARTSFPNQILVSAKKQEHLINVKENTCKSVL